MQLLAEFPEPTTIFKEPPSPQSLPVSCVTGAQACAALVLLSHHHDTDCEAL